MTACGFHLSHDSKKVDLVQMLNEAKAGEVVTNQNSPEALDARQWLELNCPTKKEGGSSTRTCPLPDGKRHVTSTELGNVGKLVATAVCCTKGNKYPEVEIEEPEMKMVANIAIARLWDIVSPIISTKSCNNCSINELKKVCVCTCEVCVCVYL